ncbi:hypothetical protein POX_f07896 [Penicillium oxalicum]|nr:hypothetical protein POX_f07896 [Penicillium oxalicum]KAI2787527.1 hypothetical protein POX_f07896 [Penicillium oxalicum]
MSAQGRQSPEPQTQSGSQLHDPPATGKIDNTSSTGGSQAPELSHEKAHNQSASGSLESNPTHALEELEAEKFKK